MTTHEMREALDAAWHSDAEHVERITLAAAIITTALRDAGMTATLVGGAAIEFYAPGSYATTDLDFVVEGRTREAIHEVMSALGFARSGRHWVLDDLFVEVPGSYQAEPTNEYPMGDLVLRVVRKEHVLADRIVGFRHWKYWAYGLQALDLLAAFGDDLDDAALRKHLRSEGAEHAYDLLLHVHRSGSPGTAEVLDSLWHQHYR
jgi:hypothetical protein